MRVIIAGSRDFDDYTIMKDVIHETIDKGLTISYIVSGCAKGADKLGEQFAREYEIPLEKYPALREELKRSAGIIRNIEMAKNADALIAFWDGESSGTKHMIQEALSKGLFVRVVKFTPKAIVEKIKKLSETENKLSFD